MRAIRTIGAGKIELIETPVPEVKPGHALIKTEKVALCGSDVRILYHPYPGETLPRIGVPGHEVIGRVESVQLVADGNTQGSPGPGVAVGDRALVLVPTEDAMAEYFQVPIEYVLTLPEGRSDEEFLMAQQLGTVIFACKHLPNLVGGTAVVIGQGSAGLHWDTMLRRIGLARIVGLDLRQARVDAATRFGATEAFRVDPADDLGVTSKTVKDLTRGRMADIVVVAAGEKEAFQMAPDLVAKGGRIQFFGVPHETKILFDFNNLFRTYCTTHSTGASIKEPGLSSFRQALRLVGDGEIDVKGMVTHRLPLERVADAYELARTRADGAVKTVVDVIG